jgi:hypothetical protein
MTTKYGSPVGLKLVKYFLEHKLAREQKGFSIYELTFNIPPSLVLTKETLIKIQSIADDTPEEASRRSFDLLVEKGIFKIDTETGILELAVPTKSIANLFLIETSAGFDITEDANLATVILLPTGSRDLSESNFKDLSNISGVTDMMVKEKNGQWIVIENKFV